MKHKAAMRFFVTLMLAVASAIPAAQGVIQSAAVIVLEVDTYLDTNQVAYQVCSSLPEDCSLRGAISRANADREQEYLISMGAGVFGFALSGTDEDGNQSGDLDLFGKIQISGAGAASTIITGNYLDRVFDIYTGSVIGISDISITGGRAPNGDIVEVHGSTGGGIINRGNLSLENCLIEDNAAGDGREGTWDNKDGGNGGDGGGIFNLGVIEIKNGYITNNMAGKGGLGWAIWGGINGGSGGDGGSGGGIYSSGSLTLMGTTVSNNIAQRGGSGGCPYKWCAPSGLSGRGGGIFTIGSSRLEESQIRENITGVGLFDCTDGGEGGAIYNGGDMEILTSGIVGNLTGSGGAGYNGCDGGKGGGIYNRHNLTIVSSEVISNTTGRGGSGSVGFDAAGVGGPGGAGGGIYNSGTLELVYAEIANNKTGGGGPPGGSGGDGGGLYNMGLVMDYGSSFAFNTTGNGSEEDHPGMAGNGGFGGGIYNENTLWGRFTSVSSNTTGIGGLGFFSDSGGQGGYGGGIYNSGILNIASGLLGANKTGSGGDGSDESEYYAAADGGHGGHGGGFFNQGGLMLDGISVKGNATGSGGTGGSGELPGVPGLGGYGGGIYLAEGLAAKLNSVVTAENMVPHNALGSGVYLQGSNVESLHNTIARNSGGDGSGIFASQSTITLTNTILVSHTVGITATLGSTITLDTTLWGAGLWANGSNWAGAGEFTVTNELTGDPAFASPESGDYHIYENSDARDAGTWSESLTDLDNQPRPNPDTGLADIGADEYWLFTPLSEISVSGPITATAYTPITFTAQIIPEDATPNILYVWTPIPEAGQGTESAVFTWDVEGMKSVFVRAINTASQVTSSTTITIYPGYMEIFLPMITH